MQPAARVRHEDEAACGCQQACQRRLRKIDRPGNLAGDRVAGVEMTVRLAARWISNGELGGDVELRLRLCNRRCFLDRQVHAPFIANLEVVAGGGVIGTGVPANAAIDRWAERLLWPFA